MENDMQFVWRGKHLEKMGQIMDAAVAITTREEAQEFLTAYQATCTKPGVAAANIGYAAGYYSQDTAQRLYELFSVEHPIFGRNRPTSDEAFQAGLKLGTNTGGQTDDA
ncbi:hypothetical protein LCGC14_0552150 [marine sediment metagenome]|uniref:Uncharacterized protein n=1 Tax=marine sediment metagenome TaxID=412755 RepID=A0A0F9S836_9ZZZZ